VAKIVSKKKPGKKKHKHGDVESRAFDMYVTLNSELKHVYKLSRIAKDLNIPLSKLIKWRKKGRWKERLEEAIEKGRERAANSKQMKELLTSYLYGEQTPAEVGVDPAKIVEVMERRKGKRITRVVKYVGDVIYEIRAYNHLMFRALTSKQDSNKFPQLALPLGGRDTAHRAWMDSLSKLMELFGVTTIKGLAMEMLANDTLGAHLQKEAKRQGQEGMAVNINIGSNAEPTTLGNLAEGTTVTLSDSSHELILKTMLPEGSKINGPVGYTGPKEKNVFDGAEDAVVTKQGRPDSESEE
jgi:hypothetical protein